MKLLVENEKFFLQSSPPTRGRGLKLSKGKISKSNLMSPPTRGRGLKRIQKELYININRSPPTRGRGLKH
ncbi:MAG: hypothetical protein N2114_03065, partial [Candidatus Goldbacteria bacterium]|nr:hypothetical protein [Candidatus Goldiibacteriota bacterium]